MRMLHWKWCQVLLIFALKLLMFYLILALLNLLHPLLLLIYYTSPKLLDCELWVSTPSGVMLCVQWMYRNCVINIASRDLVAGLILSHMHDFDAILGMDWLSTHHAVVECFEKHVVFHIPGLPPDREIEFSIEILPGTGYYDF